MLYLSDAPPQSHEWFLWWPEPHSSAVWVKGGLPTPVCYPGTKQTKAEVDTWFGSGRCMKSTLKRSVLTLFASIWGTCSRMTSSNSSDRGFMSFFPCWSCSWDAQMGGVSNENKCTQAIRHQWVIFISSKDWSFIDRFKILIWISRHIYRTLEKLSCLSGFIKILFYT